MFKDLSIKSKLFIAFAIVMAIAVAGNLIILQEVYALQQNANALRELRHIPDFSQGAVGQSDELQEILELEEAQEKTLREIVNDSYYLIGAMLFVGFLIGYAISSYHSRVLRSLQKVVEALGRGEFWVRIPVDSEDEIGRLGRALNKMARALQDEEVRMRLRNITDELGER